MSELKLRPPTEQAQVCAAPTGLGAYGRNGFPPLPRWAKLCRPWRDFGVKGYSKKSFDSALEIAVCPHILRIPG